PWHELSEFSCSGRSTQDFVRHSIASTACSAAKWGSDRLTKTPTARSPCTATRNAQISLLDDGKGLPYASVFVRPDRHNRLWDNSCALSDAARTHDRYHVSIYHVQ